MPDAPAEGDETFFANLSPVNPAVGVFEPEATIIITENGVCVLYITNLFQMVNQIHTILTAVVPMIFFSTENVVVGEGDGVAEVCLNLSVPLSTDLSVEVSSTPGSGIIKH